MKSKLAVWSFISVITIIILGFGLGDVLYKAEIIWIFYFLFLLPLILGIFGLIEIKRNKKLTGRGFAIAGIIISILLYLINLIPLFVDLGTGNSA